MCGVRLRSVIRSSTEGEGRGWYGVRGWRVIRRSTYGERMWVAGVECSGCIGGAIGGGTKWY